MKIYRMVLAGALAIWFLSGFQVGFSLADETFDEVSTADRLYVKGLVSGVDVEHMQISVRPPKGKSIRVRIEPETILEGIAQIDEFEKEQQVKVWYSVDDDGNRAVKIVKMMDLGC